MDEKTFKVGEHVIEQGDKGEVLYVVEEGQLDCFKLFPGDKEPKFLKTYQPGEAFGELALLYNAPRAATITAKTNSTLYELDRNTFNHIVKDASQRKRDKYDDFLGSVPILSSIDHYERSKIADVLKEHTFAAGEQVITEGDEGHEFFLIISGEAFASKTLEAGKAPQEVMQYKAGDYFGELVLLRDDQKRAANVFARNNLKVVTINQDSFKRLLGPLDEILKRNMENYENYIHQ